MKTMKYIKLMLMALLMTLSINAFAKADKQVVTLSVDIHCQGCIDKIMHEIAFERGVKDIVCSLPEKTVVVTYDANKTDIPTLQKAFDRIKKPAEVISSTQQMTQKEDKNTEKVK
ncbi:MAG: cation transporter [Paludibacteraceae bacterium]|nr:cation transporter [Paludibacteraceae bacterium]